MPKTKRQYWAVGLNFDYNITSFKPDSMEWGSIEGPFGTLSEAKTQVREWIKSDRAHLANELFAINSLKVEDFLNEN